MELKNTFKFNDKKIIKQLEKRIIDISYKHNLSHLNSCISSLPIIYNIYKKIDLKKDKFVLSNGHAGLALYVVLEYFCKPYYNAEFHYLENGIHPTKSFYIDASTGSLGCGIAIATGFAVADKYRKVYCIISDGECSEGIVWESLQFISDNKINNIEIHVNYNGTSAYRYIDYDVLAKRLRAFLPTINIHRFDMNHPILKSINLNGKCIDAHYKILNNSEYEEISKTIAI